MNRNDDDYLEFEGDITAQSGKAILFQAHFWDEPQWLPRSQIVIVPNARGEDETQGNATVRIKAWLCKKNQWSEA